jgi:hypothetical protein
VGQFQVRKATALDDGVFQRSVTMSELEVVVQGASCEAVVTGFELRFHPLSDLARVLCFPCDKGGRVELDALTDYARNNYLYARAMIGVEFALPTVHAVEAHWDTVVSPAQH